MTFRTRYLIDGESLTFKEIQMRAPPRLLECTLRKRLAYGWRTERALFSAPNYRKRTYPVRNTRGIVK